MDARELPRAYSLLGAHFLNAIAQSQAAVVLPWIALSHGSGVSKAILISLATLIPYLLLFLPAGRISDRRDPLPVIRFLFLLSGTVLALVPLLYLLTGHTSLIVAIAGCCVVAGTRPFLDGAIYRAVQSVREPTGQIKLQGLRSALAQAGSFGGPALGLALLPIGGPALIFTVISALLFLSAITLFVVPTVPAAVSANGHPHLSVKQALTSLFAVPRLRFVVVATFCWNIAAMIAFSLVTPILKIHLGLSAHRSSAAIALAAALVLGATLPACHHLAQKVGSIVLAFSLMMVVEAAMFALFLPKIGLFIFLCYPLFLLSNSVVASLTNTERTLTIPEENHSLLQVTAIIFVFVGNFSGILLASLLTAFFSLESVMVIAVAAIALCGLACSALWFRQRQVLISENT